MKIHILIFAGILAAGPALGQSRQYEEPSESPNTIPRNPVTEEVKQPQQQAELPAEPHRQKHPGTILKLRGGFMDGPVVEGDQNPENSLGYAEPKKSQ